MTRVRISSPRRTHLCLPDQRRAEGSADTPAAAPVLSPECIFYHKGCRGELAPRKSTGVRRNAWAVRPRVLVSVTFHSSTVSSCAKFSMIPLGQLVAYRIRLKRLLKQPHSATLWLEFSRARAAGRAAGGWLPRPSPSAPLRSRPRAGSANLQGSSAAVFSAHAAPRQPSA